MTCLHAKFQVTNSSVSSVKPIAVRVKAKEKNRTDKMSFYTQKKYIYYPKRNCTFYNDTRLLPYRSCIK